MKIKAILITGDNVSFETELNIETSDYIEIENGIVRIKDPAILKMLQEAEWVPAETVFKNCIAEQP